MNWKEIYKLPLHIVEDSNIVYTQDNKMAFEFATSWNCFRGDEFIYLDDSNRQIIVDIINGKEVTLNIEAYKYTKEECEVLVNNSILLRVRGWGYLIGRGGLDLSVEEATKIQDEFINYIIEKLRNATIKTPTIN